MRKMTIGAAGACLVLLVILAVGAAAGTQRPVKAADTTRPPVQAVGSPGIPQPDMRPGQHLVPSAEVSSIDSATAMARVGDIVRPQVLASASSITIGKFRFSSDELDTSVVPANDLVWVVTINGVNIPFRGGASLNTTAGTVLPVAHQLNVIVDANTGQPLVGLTGMVTRN